MEELAKRIRQASERLLENERLTAELDDQAAQVLLNWGLDSAKRIVQSTEGLDDQAAEEVTYPRHRANRRLIRSVSQWAAEAGQPKVTGTEPKAAQENQGGWLARWFKRLAEPKPESIETDEIDEGSEVQVEGNLSLLEAIIEQAKAIYGESFQSPSLEARKTFLKQTLSRGRSEILIQELRTFLETYLASETETGGADPNLADTHTHSNIQSTQADDDQRSDTRSGGQHGPKALK